jgi:hypothetical protein
MLCASTHDVETKECWHQYQTIILLDGIWLEIYLLPQLVHPRLLQPPSGSPFHGCRPDHDLLVLVVVLLVLLRYWKLTVAELLSSGNDSSSDLVPHNGNIHDLLLVLSLPGYSGWLLGQEDEVHGCSIAGTGFLPVGCSSDTVVVAAAAEGTIFDTAAGAGADSDAGVLEGDSTRTVGVDCLKNKDDCYSQPVVHRSCASGLPSPGASSQS